MVFSESVEAMSPNGEMDPTRLEIGADDCYQLDFTPGHPGRERIFLRISHADRHGASPDGLRAIKPLGNPEKKAG
ncbi:hypothetical protein ACS73_16675 [Pseudomonas lini]|nr:hypothetical protein ACS73_16675 [Pseudomonas lini]